MLRKVVFVLRTRSLLALVLVILFPTAGSSAKISPVEGVIWQLHESAPPAIGRWHRLGARELLVQWTVVDGTAYVPGTAFRPSRRMPDWSRIRREPWASKIIVGLSGRFSEGSAREELDQLGRESIQLSRVRFPFRVSGWYFPAEVDPTWSGAPRLVPILNQLPRPLWISVYDGANIGPENLASWLEKWLPKDVGIFFHDGVGVWARTPEVARRYADVLAQRLGKRRVKLIVEAFRPTGSATFRAATPAELQAQLRAYGGHSLYLFDGPHYVSDRTVDALVAARVLEGSGLE
jgi:hypothetical protein